MTINEFSLKLSQFRKESKYKEGLLYFKKHKHLFSVNEIKKDSYILFNIILFLKKTNNCKFIFDFLNRYNISILEMNKIVATNLSWCLLDNNYELNIQKSIKIFKDLIPVLEKYQESKIISLILKKCIHLIENDKSIINKNCLLLKFLSIFNPIFLLNDKNYFSSKEYYYLRFSKILREKKEFEQSITISEEGLREIKFFHKDTDVWLKRNIALCKRELGNLEESLNILKELYKKKQDWFFLYDISVIFYKKQQYEEAFENLIYIMNLNIPIKSKVKSIYLLGEVLEKLNNPVAIKHYIFLALFYKKNEWKIKKELQEKLRQIEIDNVNYFELKKELQKFWEKNDKNLKIGYIVKILHNNEKGIDGFIKADKKEYYFSISRKNKIVSLLKEHIKVKFKFINNRTFILEVINDDT